MLESLFLGLLGLVFCNLINSIGFKSLLKCIILLIAVLYSGIFLDAMATFCLALIAGILLFAGRE